MQRDGDEFKIKNYYRMKKSFFILALLLLTVSLQAQYVLTKMTLSKIRAFEDSIKSECKGFVKMNVGADFFKGAKEDKDYYPLVFSRTDKSFFPGCKVEYYYSGKDSVIQCVVMDWDIMNYVSNLNTDQHFIDEQVGRKKAYYQKYEQVEKDIIALIGDPTILTDVTKEEIFKFDNGFSVETRWTSSKRDVILSVSFTSPLKVINNKWRVGTFRIRLQTEFKK